MAKGKSRLNVAKLRFFWQRTTELRSGDALYIYTDGVIEALDESGAEYGEDRLARQVAALGTTDAAASLSRIFESVDRFAGAVPQYDDITCLVLRVAAAGAAVPSVRAG
jgi:sigma-B regulation protein RsbU (phosphoserine phosphatase)